MRYVYLLVPQGVQYVWHNMYKYKRISYTSKRHWLPFDHDTIVGKASEISRDVEWEREDKGDREKVRGVKVRPRGWRCKGERWREWEKEGERESVWGTGEGEREGVRGTGWGCDGEGERARGKGRDGEGVREGRCVSILVCVATRMGHNTSLTFKTTIRKMAVRDFSLSVTRPSYSFRLLYLDCSSFQSAEANMNVMLTF